MKIALLVILIVLAATNGNAQAARSGADTDRVKIFSNPEISPQFPGGEDALMKFLAKNLKWPANGDIYGSGKVVIGFTILKSGSLTDFKILKSLHPLIDQEALRVVKLMPKWNRKWYLVNQRKATI